MTVRKVECTGRKAVKVRRKQKCRLDYRSGRVQMSGWQICRKERGKGKDCQVGEYTPSKTAKRKRGTAWNHKGKGGKLLRKRRIRVKGKQLDRLKEVLYGWQKMHRHNLKRTGSKLYKTNTCNYETHASETYCILFLFIYVQMKEELRSHEIEKVKEK